MYDQEREADRCPTRVIRGCRVGDQERDSRSTVSRGSQAAGVTEGDNCQFGSRGSQSTDVAESDVL